MSKQSGAAAITVFCHPDGAVLAVWQDELGLKPFLQPGSLLVSHLAANSMAHAMQFLQVVHEKHCARGYQLDVRTSAGTVPLYFSGCQIDRGILVIATKRPLTYEALLLKVVRLRSWNTMAGSGGLKPESGSADPSAMLTATAYDLGNRVNGILAASQYLIEDTGSSLHPEQRSLLQSINSSSRSMLKTITDLIDLVAVETGNLKFYAKSTDVATLVRASVLSNRLAAERKRVRLDAALPPAIRPLTVDHARTAGMIDRLLRTAIESAVSGSRVEIVAGRQDHKAVISAQAERAAISPEEARSLIYSERRGLRGMAPSAAEACVARRITEDLGFKINVESAARSGLIFTLEVPG